METLKDNFHLFFKMKILIKKTSATNINLYLRNYINIKLKVRKLKYQNLKPTNQTIKTIFKTNLLVEYWKTTQDII